MAVTEPTPPGQPGSLDAPGCACWARCDSWVARNSKGQFTKGHHWREPKPFWDREYLDREYTEKGKSSSEIAAEHGCTDNNIQFWLRKHGIRRRTVSEVRLIKHWGAEGPNNPMFGIFGEASPNWKGGKTPERQRFYSSLEWAAAVKIVFERDNGTCQRCGATPRGHRAFCVHHIAPFRVEHLRADPGNLVLLCSACHGWVHSKKNIHRDFLASEGG